MASSERGSDPASRPGRGLYGGLPPAGPPGFAPRLLDLGDLRERIRAAIRRGEDGEMRDLARLAIAAFGRQGESSGVIGVDVQRIRRALELRQQSTQLEATEGLDRENLRRFERHLRKE